MILDKNNQKILPGHLLLVKHIENNKTLLYRGFVRTIDKDNVSLNIDNQFITVPIAGREIGDSLILDKRQSWAVVEG